MQINGNQLVVYVNGEPVGICTEPFEIPRYSVEVLPITGSNHEFTFEGLYKFDDFSIEQQWNYNWYASMWLPRKQKKAYRKKLSKAIGYELYREAYMNELKKWL